MLDHVFTDAIGAIRDALETALLERQAFEERFQVDVLLGDTTWETTYSLPGEGIEPHVQVDITMMWATWAQTAYRSWYLSEAVDEPPRIAISLSFRLQQMKSRLDPDRVVTVLPQQSVDIGAAPLQRQTSRIELEFDQDQTELGWSIEVSYQGEYELPESVLADGSELDEQLSDLGGWISSMLIRLGDIGVEHLPPNQDH
ncbi:MAG: hypothetical protein GXP35_15105 [Actinobacteria bacterium]|nr:hypothetical protein [Actinomycetota bacterium]